MKKHCLRLALSLALVLGGGAEPPTRAMVLKVDGSVLNAGQPVLTGQVLDSGSKLTLNGKSRLTLLLLNRGQRLQVQGLGWMQLGEQGVELSPGVTSVVLDSNQQKLSLTGDNKRNIGGGVYRSRPAAQILKDTPFDRIEVRDGGAGLVFWRPAGQGRPPKLRFRYLYQYDLPESAQGKASILQPGQVDEVYSALVEGEKQGNRWRWEVAWPKGDDQRMGMLVTPENGGEPLLYTMVYQTNPEEERELTEVRAQTRAWAQREPKSAEPMVVYASLLENRGRLEEANQELARALGLAGGDVGLRKIKARVLWELGRYSQAAPP